MSRDYDRSHTDEEAVRHEAVAAQTEVRGGASEFLLVGTGFAMLVTGVALAVLPTVMPTYGWMVHSLAARGVTSSPMLVGSFVLWGVWLAARASRSRARFVQEAASSTSPSIDKLASEIAHLGDGLQGLRIEFVYLKDALQSQQPAPANDAPADAMYRLAASLDQLGARVEGRLHASHSELHQALQGVAATIEALKAASLAAPTVVVEATDHQGVEYAPHGEHAHDASTNGARLGLLDMLDDLGRLLPRKATSHVVRPPAETDPFGQVQDEGWKHTPSIPGPLPTGREEIRAAGPGELLAGGRVHPSMDHDEEPLGDKLAELRDLLADERIREALASLERLRQ